MCQLQINVLMKWESLDFNFDKKKLIFVLLKYIFVTQFSLIILLLYIFKIFLNSIVLNKLVIFYYF